MDLYLNFATNDINADIFNTVSSSVANSTVNTSTVASSMILGGFAGFMVFLIIFACMIGVAITILRIVATWKIFTKAGQAGWKCLIPIYSTVILYKVAGISPLWVLGYLAAIIPVVGAFVTLGITIYLNISLGKAFGKSTGFIVGLILLNTIFTLILGFGSSEYQLEKKA